MDRAALDVAKSLGIEVGGWCPRGRLAEDGPIGARYPLRETPELDPAQRTEWNVRDSGGTLIISPFPPAGGTSLTLRQAERMERPVLVVDPDDADAVATVRAWLDEHAIATLNIAGPRESDSPGIYEQASHLLLAILE